MIEHTTRLRQRAISYLPALDRSQPALSHSLRRYTTCACAVLVFDIYIRMISAAAPFKSPPDSIETATRASDVIYAATT